MKKIILFLFVLPFISIAQVGVNTTVPKGALDVESTNNGVLIPRVQLTSILDNTTIVNPNLGALETSTLVYNIAPSGVSPNNVVAGFYYWSNNSIPAQWIPISRGSGWNLNGNTAITSPANPAIYGTSTIGTTENFIGTTDNNDVIIGTNNIERMRVKITTGNIGIGMATAPAKLSVFGGFSSPTFPNITTNAMVRIGNNNEGLDIGKSGAANNYAAWFQSGYNGSTADPISFQPLGGNVGVATTNPNLARLQVDGMTGNTTALFRGNSTTSQGISMVADWPGIYFNSYYNGAIRSMAGSGFTSIINTDQSTGGLVFQTTNVANPASGTAIASVPTRMTIAGNGNVGIGAPSPSNLLHINSATSGAVRIVDGTQANGRVLTSNVFGVATWQEIGINNVVGTAGFGGITIPTTQTSGFLNTGKTITLPPGRWVVNVTMLLSVYQTPATPPTPNDSSFWLRTCFADPTTLATLTRTMDTVGSYYVSGNLPGTSMFSLMSGSVIINNTTGANRTYTYLAGEVLTFNTTTSLRTFTGWGEDSIVAYRLN